MPSSVPNYLTTDAAGAVGADFSGHIHAAGLDLDEANNTGISPVNAVSWLDAGGLPRGFVEGITIPGEHGIVVNSDAQGGSQAALQLYSDTAAPHSSIFALAGGQTKLVIDDTGLSDFSVRIGSTSGAGASLNFNNIPQTFTHLLLRVIGQSDKAAANNTDLVMRMNGISAAVYDNHYQLWFNNANSGPNVAIGQTSWFLGKCPAAGRANDNYVTLHDIVIPNYSSTNIVKSIISNSGGGDGSGGPGSGLLMGSTRGIWYGDNAAITSLSILESTGANLATRAAATLYGIK